MRNILDRSEFNKKIVEEKIFEEKGTGGFADLSNRTGWSTSLLGRAINKIFSWAKKGVELQILKKYRDQLYNEYMRGVMIALNTEDIDVVSISTTTDTTTEVNNTNTTGNTIQQQNTQSSGETSNTNDNQLLLPEYETPKVKNIRKTIQQKLYKPEIDNIVLYLGNLYDFNNINSDSIKQSKQYKVLGYDNKKLKVVAIDNKKDIKELPISTQLKKTMILPQYTKDWTTKIDSYKSDLLSKLKKTNKFTAEEKTKLENIITTSLLYSIDGTTAEQTYNRIKTLLLQTSENVSDNNFLQYYVYKNAINELKDMIVDFESLNEDIKALGTGGNDSVSTINNTTDNTNTTDNNVTISGEPTKKSTNDTQVQDAVIVQDEPSKNEIVSKNKTKLIVDDDSIISRDAQKAEDKYNMPADEFDIEKTKKLFKQNPNLRTVAISSINKEALKEIQLKAEWLYDTKKGNDERSGVYSRINWTTTQPDMKKLENTWKQYIANTKSMFNDLFKDESGNFPKDIDPIALANSDETFRKEFKQYAEEGKTKTPIIGGSNSEMSSEEIVAFGFESNDLNDGNYGIFKCTSTLGEQFGMFVQKIEAGSSTDKVIMYKFIGILDIKKMMLDFNRMSPNDKKDTGKIHELLRKYTYLSTIESIGHEKDKEMLKIYNGYNYTDNKFKGFNFNTIYCASQNIKTGSSYLKGFIQLSAISKDNNDFQYFISTVSENGKAILGAIPIDNLDLKKMKIKFRFRVQEFYKIDEEFELYKDLFEIIKKKNINTKLREKLKNNTNVIKKLSEIFSNKDYRTQ